MRLSCLAPILAVALAATGSGSAQPTPGDHGVGQAQQRLPFLSPIFADNMVLQRGKPNLFWGWSEPGDRIVVEAGGHTGTGIARADGRWQVQMDPPATGGPYTVSVRGRQTVELKNVLVGDVWLCGGQSNMQLTLPFARNGAAEVQAAHEAEIRFFNVAGHVAYRPTSTVAGDWKVITPETAASVSAVAYYFARSIQRELHVPIGLVVDAMGGTPAEAWTSAEALRTIHDFDLPLGELSALAAAGAPEYGNYVMHWYDRYDAGLKQQWQLQAADDSTWKTVQLPGGFAELGFPVTPAIAWFRKSVPLPDPLPMGSAKLSLGSIERMDTAWINGVEVGASAWVENPRMYAVPDGLLKPGQNEIVVRVLKTQPDGGFLSKPADLYLRLGDQSVIALAGAWKGNISLDARPPQPMPIGFENWPVLPTVLYEGMLCPIAPLAIAGALWYQGEQNSERGWEYRRLLPAMIADWRKLFGQGDFPFYLVSLPAFKQRSLTPVAGDAWAELRESQAVAAHSVPNTCLAVTIDTGDAGNIHPQDKLPVGERLARCALAGFYGRLVVDSGPTFASVERLPGAMRIHFTHTDGGLHVQGEQLEEFSVAGVDHQWHWAKARIDGDTVMVSSTEVADPQEVRYAWQSNPAATLFNGAGLPAVPFRSDAWPTATEGQRPY